MKEFAVLILNDYGLVHKLGTILLFLRHPALPDRLPYTPCYVVKLVELQRTSIADGTVKEEELWPVVFGGGSEWT